MLGPDLDVRKDLRFFERFEEFNLAFIGGSANSKSYAGAAVFEVRRNIDDAHSRRQRFLEVHEDFGPRESALADERIQEGGAVEDLMRRGSLKIRLQRTLFLLVGANFTLPMSNLQTDVAVGAPGNVRRMPED
jgi:hypothetical protein